MSAQPKKSSGLVLLKSAMLGSVAGMSSLVFEHPFDALKTNMQSRQQNLRTAVKSMLRDKGWRAFYNGFSLNLLRIAFKQAYRWPLWITISTFYKQLLPSVNQVVKQTVTGFSISICQLALITPLERIKVWLMTTKSQQQTKIRKYYQESFSIRDIYRGFVPTVIRQGLSWSSFLSVSQVSKNFIKQYKGTTHLNGYDLFVASLPVSLVNTLFIMPMDCIKTFYQDYGRKVSQQKPFIEVVKKFYKTYGLKGLYLGWSARLVQYQINSAFTLILIEDLFRQYKNKN